MPPTQSVRQFRLICWPAVGALLALSLSYPLTAVAQAWPTKQSIKLVAVFPPGGSVDQVARLLAPDVAPEKRTP